MCNRWFKYILLLYKSLFLKLSDGAVKAPSVFRFVILMLFQVVSISCVAAQASFITVRFAPVYVEVSVEALWMESAVGAAAVYNIVLLTLAS